MNTFLTLDYEQETDLPSGFVDDVRTPEAYVRHFLREHSEPGDTVFDPFAGFGTTLAVAAELGRVPAGVEYETDRAEFVRDRLGSEHSESLVHGSALDLADFDLPAFDCCLTSPPYMVAGMGVDPLENYAGESDYGRYLDQIGDVFAQVRDLAAPDASLLVDVSNMKHDGEVTTLAWDVADAVAESFRFEGEVVVGWEGEEQPERDGGSYGYGYDHSYCLVFAAEGGG
ncbi:DNA methyltransferase [Halorussus litoreus]|uniref:DNA methyltransferase n=1 Tax=Halorussus litoreus TaxID=1710536 RepID=UPI000E24366A|nr:DNA methyltransferase [Halorussus litoreus]